MIKLWGGNHDILHPIYDDTPHVLGLNEALCRDGRIIDLRL